MSDIHSRAKISLNRFLAVATTDTAGLKTRLEKFTRVAADLQDADIPPDISAAILAEAMCRLIDPDYHLDPEAV